MSIQKLEIVKSARKDQGKCSRCGVELPASSAYQYWYPGFRSKTKIVRCMKAECTPRPSERETSKASTILAAQESFADTIDELDSPEDIEAAVQEVGAALREVADEYQEAVDQWAAGNEQLQEKVDVYEPQADEIENWSWDGNTDYDLCYDHEGQEDNVPEEEIQQCLACQSKREEWLDECREAARDIVDSIELA